MKKKDAGSTPELTPERVIRGKLHRLYGKLEIISFFEKLILMVVLLVVLFGYAFGITPMKSNDMSPRLSAGDLLLYYRLETKFRSDDVVVFDKNGTQYVGRIVAKGGDAVEITEDSQLKINNSTMVETGIFYQTIRYGDQITYPVELKEDEYFILCDYRNGAKDSRYFGAVKQDEIRGKVITVIRRSDL